MFFGKRTFLRFFCLLTSGLAFALAHPETSQAQSPFQLVGNSSVIGLETNYNVASGPTSGSQRFYAAFFNESPGGTFSVLSIDPSSGDTLVMHSPLAGEYGAWGMAVGPDGNVYLGTTPSGHFMRVNTASGTITDLGRPSSTETYIWSVTFGSDGRLYGVTYPNCKLVRYDPASGQMADLGRLDPAQQYAKSVVATADGYIYAAVGANAANVAVYQISTGTVREILPSTAQLATFPTLHVGVDGKAYAQVNSLNFLLSPTSATQVTASQVSPALPHNLTSDGSYVTLNTVIVSGAYALSMTVTNPKAGTSKTTQLAYAGDPVNVWRLGVGPAGGVYGSTILPADLFEVNSGQGGLTQLGNAGSGEIYSFLPYGNNLAMAAYYGTGSLMSYNPGSAIGGSGSSQNPSVQNYTGSDPGWRPESIAQGADGHIYTGGQAGVGQSNGPLVEWNPAAGTAQIDATVTNQLISSLVPWQNEIIGGTSMISGGTTTTGTLFAWDTVGHRVAWSVIPVPGATAINDLVSASNGLIYGIADATVFEFNPATQTVTRSVAINFPPGGLLYNSAALDTAGRIWGLSPSGVFVIDTKTLYAALLAPSPVAITRGWAMNNGEIYFGSGASVYSYTMPTTAGSITITPAQTSFPSNSTLGVTVKVAGSNPTGTVTLTAGSYTSSPTALAGGSATFTVPANSYSAGSADTITAFYSGDQSNLYSSASIPVTPAYSAPSVSVGLSASSILVGQGVNVSVAVSGNSAAPTGSVTLTAGTYTAQATLSNQGATFAVPAGSMSPGSAVVTAAYSGNSYYGSGTGSKPLTVTQATPTVRLSTSASTIAVGSTITATVAVSGSTGTPSGTVTLKAGTYTGSASLVNGGASFTIPGGSMPVGTNTISIAYSGDKYYLSGSSTTSVSEIKATPTVSISPATLTASIGAAQSFTVTVSGGAGAPTGSVTLWGPSYNFGAVTLSNQQATFSIPAGKFAVGSITLTASYSGDGNYTAATGNAALTETQTTASITVSPASSSVSASKALSVTTTVLGPAGTPSGTVTLNAGTYTASAALSGGWASFSVPAGSLPQGTDTVTIKYGGNTSYLSGAGSAQVTVTP
jgi:hypothetical protein